MKSHKGARTLAGSLNKRPKLKKMDIRFGTWNERSLCRARSLMKVAKEISKYKLDLVGVHKVRWDRGGTKAAGKYTFFYGKGNENHELDTGFFVHKVIISQLRGLSLLLTGCRT
jgi:hypothetical protein